MRRPNRIVLFALCLVSALGTGGGALFPYLDPSPAEAASVGVGAFGGVSIPIVQDDAESGTVFGARLPIHLVPLVSIEPYFASSMLADVKEDFGGITYTRDGFDITSYGVNVGLGSLVPGIGFQVFPFAGIGKYELVRDGSDDIDATGFDVGLGLGISLVPRLSLSARGELDIVKTDETSRKFANVTVGLAYALVSLP